MNRPITCLLFALLLLPLGLSAKVKLADYLPEKSWAIAEIEDVDALLEDMEKGPFGKLWNSPAMEKTRNLINEEMLDLPEGEEGEAAKELLDRLKAWGEKLSGQVAFSMGGFESIIKKDFSDEAASPVIIFLAETESTSKELSELVEWMEETDEKVSKEGSTLFIEKSKVRGHEVFWVAPGGEEDDDEDARFGAFVIDGILGFGGDRAAIEDLIERMVKKDGESIAEHPDYLDSFDEIGRGDFRVFINFRPIIAAFLDMMRQNEELEIPENPLGVTMDGIIDSLGLDGLESMAMQMDFDERGMEMGVALFMDNPKGLLRLIQSSGKAVSLVPFIPEDVSTASVASFDFGLMWDTVMDILRNVSPALHVLVDTQIKAFEQQAGVSLRKDVLGSLGTRLVSFADIDTDVLQDEKNIEELSASLDGFIGEFYAISLKDADRFDQSLRTLIDAVAPGSELFEESKHKGIVVRTLRDQTDISFSYAVTPKWLFINMGEKARILKAIARSKKPRKSLWERPDVAAALKDLPNEYTQLEYADFEALVELIKTGVELGFEDSGGESLDLDGLPEMPFFMLGWSRDVKRGMVSKVRLFPKDAE